MPPRSIVYVDGFNLYYGALKGTRHKWLNLEKLFHLLRPGDHIQQIHYFSALVGGASQADQETYLRALATLPLVNVVLGRFKLKRVLCLSSACTFGGNRFFQMPEEKHTDVNVALHMLDDAYQGRCDNLILVSGDSDLVPALRMVKRRFPAVRLILYVPANNPIRGAAVELRSAADKHRALPLNLLPHSQFHARIPDGAGGFVQKPPTW